MEFSSEPLSDRIIFQVFMSLFHEFDHRVGFKKNLFFLLFKALSGIKSSPDRIGTFRLKPEEEELVIVFQGG